MIIRDLPSVLQFLKSAHLIGGAITPGNDINCGVTCEYISMHLQQWAFPKSTFRSEDDAIPTREYNFEYQSKIDELMAGVIAVGYRCQSCRKVFFATSEEEYIHECMEAPEEGALR